ncbi:MAG: ATP-grasp domain-containing protein [Desulfovibrionaceae bacterium]
MIIEVLHDQFDTGPSGSVREDELDNLVQARAVSEALRSLGHKAGETPLGLDLSRTAQAFRTRRPELVFNLVESCDGQARLAHLAPCLLESLGLPFTGCGSYPLFVAADKLRVKELLRLAGVPSPPWYTEKRLERETKDVSGAFIVKPVYEHGSVGLHQDGVVQVNSRTELLNILRERGRAANLLYFAEAYVDGREFNISLLEMDKRPVALPPAEILFEDFAPGQARIVGYEAKWDKDSHAYGHTPRSFDFPKTDNTLLRDLKSLALACWVLFEMTGYARVDLRVDAQGRSYVIDVNPNPCIAPDAGFAASALQAGMDFTALVGAVVKAAPRASY